MHAVESSNLFRQVMLREILSESPVEFFVVAPPVDEGSSCYGFEQQQRSERASRSRNRTAACEYLRSIKCQLCE